MVSILKSLFITALVSIVVGSAGGYLYGYDIGKSIVAVCVAQFVFFAIYNNVKRFIAERHAETQMTSRIAEYSKQSVSAPCAYCGVVNYIPVRLDEDNNFKCENCGETSAVYITMTTAQKTQMIDANRLNVSSFLADKIKNDIKNNNK